MATGTITSAAALTSVPFSAALAAADAATINAALRIDKPSPQLLLRMPGGFDRAGLLYVPRRGVLQVFPGDVVAVDATGWPILVSARAAGTGAAWTVT